METGSGGKVFKMRCLSSANLTFYGECPLVITILKLQ